MSFIPFPLWFAIIAQGHGCQNDMTKWDKVHMLQYFSLPLQVKFGDYSLSPCGTIQ